MSFSIELPQTYTFSLCIDQGGHTIVDTTVEVPDTREGIARAKRTVQRLMNEYAPAAKAPAPADDPVEPEMESQAPTGSPEQEGETDPPPEKKPDGARGAAPPPLQRVWAHFHDFPAGASDGGGL